MDKTRFKKQMDFILEIDKAKNIFRQTYLSDGKRKENDAEHSWHTAVMAFVLAEYFGDVDVLKTMKMMIMHDLIEIYAGDTYCYDEEGNTTKEEREAAAAERLYSLLPEDQAEEYKALWLEFEAKESAESRFCEILDRLQPSMLNFATKGLSWKEHDIHLDQVLKRNKPALEGPQVVADYYKEELAKALEEGFLKK